LICSSVHRCALSAHDGTLDPADPSAVHKFGVSAYVCTLGRRGLKCDRDGTNPDEMELDRVIDEYASRQYGAFSRRQAEKAGFTPRMILTRVQDGTWIRLAPAVYVLASAPPKWERQMAAALLTRENPIAAGRSAAYLHGFPGFGPGRPVIMVGPGGNARSPLARVIRSQRFHDVGRGRTRGFVVTDEAETS